jgi:hypothetical protein
MSANSNTIALKQAIDLGGELSDLTAALSANKGAECAGEDYRERDSAAAPGREVVAGDILGATEGEDVADPEAERDEQAHPATEKQGQGQHEHNQQKAENSHAGNL